MPSPDPIRNSVLKFLRASYPHKLDLVVDGQAYPYADVKKAVDGLKDNDPLLLRILSSYMFTALSRAKAADAIGFDSSTLKRHLNKAADIIMQRLNHADMLPDDLFEIRDPRDNSISHSKFPKTVFRDV